LATRTGPGVDVLALGAAASQAAALARAGS